MTFRIITIFPQIFNSYFNESILKRAQKNNLINIKIHNLRDWTCDKHKTVDDAPFGGGAGMIMKIEPLFKALQAIKSQIPNPNYQKNTKTILLSAKGKTLNQQMVKKLSKYKNLIFICGRYEGVDERITKFIDEEISIGDYVLTGGEIGAMAIIDSIARLLPEVLGNGESAKYESHSTPGVLEYPHYTRPEVFIAPFNKGGKGDFAPLTKGVGGIKKFRVPKVLLSGNHKKIADWRAKKSKIVPLRKGD